MRSCLVSTLLIGTLCYGPGANAGTEIFTSFESYSSSDGAPLKSYLSDLKGPKPDEGSYALTRNYFESGFTWDGWVLSAFLRSDYNLSFHPETLDFAFREKNLDWKSPLDQDYVVDVKANQYQASGLKFGREFAVSDTVQMYVAGSYLNANDMVSGYLGKAEDGSGGVVSRTRLTFNNVTRLDLGGNLHADYYFTDDPLFRGDVYEPTGDGYSIDFGLSWRVNKELSLELMLDDAIGEIHWHDLSHTVVDATSNTDRLEEDEDGILRVAPNYEGRTTKDSYKQALTTRSRFNVHYRVRQYYLGYEFDDMGIADFHRVSVGYEFGARWGLKSSIDIDNGALGLVLRAPAGDFNLTLDGFDVNNLQTLGFGWSIHIPIFESP